MQWYVYLVTIAATTFLSKVSVELLCRPMQTVLGLRREALARTLSCRDISLPKPREFAVTSREIREYDEAVRKLRNADRMFADLGARFLALGESEPLIRALAVFFGLDIVLAGRELINLSQAYAAATSNDELRHEVEKALRAIGAALASSHHQSSNGLIKIRLEPMRLNNVGYPRKSYGAPVRPRAMSPRASGKSPPKKTNAAARLSGHRIFGFPEPTSVKAVVGNRSRQTS
jgi:hypothetical protein